jgi:hypothetical protein
MPSAFAEELKFPKEICWSRSSFFQKLSNTILKVAFDGGISGKERRGERRLGWEILRKVVYKQICGQNLREGD